jgi:hypothetical protein
MEDKKSRLRDSVRTQLGHVARSEKGQKPVVSRRTNLCVQTAELFDHLIGRHPNDQRHRKAKRLKGLQIDR